MKIVRYEHNDEQKRELFSLIGEACASMTVRKALSNPITSTPGDIWLLAMDGENLLGFCALTQLKSRKAVVLHAFYSVESPLALTVDNKLRMAAEAAARKIGATEIDAVDFEARHRAYENLGWKVVSERGKQFRLYRKSLKGDE